MDRHIITMFLFFTNRIGTHGSPVENQQVLSNLLLLSCESLIAPVLVIFIFLFRIEGSHWRKFYKFSWFTKPLSKTIGYFWKCLNGVQCKLTQVFSCFLTVMIQYGPGWVRFSGKTVFERGGGINASDFSEWKTCWGREDTQHISCCRSGFLSLPFVRWGHI